MEDNVTISKRRYNELLHAEVQLTELEAAGVDNWEGYEEAMKSYYSRLEEGLSPS